MTIVSCVDNLKVMHDVGCCGGGGGGVGVYRSVSGWTSGAEQLYNMSRLIRQLGEACFGLCQPFVMILVVTIEVYFIKVWPRKVVVHSSSF